MLMESLQALGTLRCLGLLVLFASYCAIGESFQLETRNDVLSTARLLAADLFTFYHGNRTGEMPGVMPSIDERPIDDYWWWQGGAFMGTYIDYWHLTRDDRYNKAVVEGILHQKGPDNDFLPLNWTYEIANEDQCIWALAAMSAAESGFPNPASDEPQWLDLSTAVFEEQVMRWDSDETEDTCNGGLRGPSAYWNLENDFKSCRFSD